jgi:predicted permease
VRFWRSRRDEDFADEVRAHLALEVDRLIDEGMTPTAARAAARRAFGNVAAAQERFHESSRWVWFEQFVQDLRYAWRTLRASPAFAVTAVATLAVGLSLITVAFTVFNAYVLRPFPVAGANRLYRIAWRAPQAAGHFMPWAKFDELRGRTDLFDAVVAQDMHFASSDGRTLVASYVSSDYFSALRPRMRLGRALAPADAGQPAAVLGEQAWSRLFDADPNVLDRVIDLDGRQITVVGVARGEFGGLDDFPRDIWLAAGPAEQRPIEVVARLRSGMTQAQAEAQLAAFAARLAPAAIAAREVRAVLVPNATANPLSVGLVAMLSPVFAAFTLVLLAACFNVSSVMLSRAIARHREIAVRLSIGASSARIVRQLLTEGLLIAALAGGTALTLAVWLVRGGTVLLFNTLPPLLASLLRVAPMPFDARVFAFAFAIAAAATLGFALLPALQASRQPLTDALRGARGGRAPASRLRHALVVAQVAVSIILITTALLLARNFVALAATNLGYSTANVYSINVRDGKDQLIPPLARALAVDPRIAAVAVTGGNPLFVTHVVPAAPDASATATPTPYTFVSPEYLTILRMPMVRGRSFRPEEARAAARVAVVSESTAHAFWPDVDPIGRTIRIERPPAGWMDQIDGYKQVTVIGTVGDVVSGLMVEGRDTGHIYLPMADEDPHVSALLFTPRAGAFRPDMLREAFRRIGGDPTLVEVVPLDEMRQTQVYPLQAAAWVGALVGVIALVLSVSGLYGVLAYTLAQRRREIGIRMALGATAAAIVRLMLRQSAQMAAIGIAIGLVVSFSVLKALASVVRLRQVSLLDPIAFAGAVLIVAAATALSAYRPSRRATRVDPAETLRTEA